jgi:hypothetical protein
MISCVMASSSDIILDVLWQSEGLAGPSVVLSLDAQVLGLCCISTIPGISGFPMKANNPNDLKTSRKHLKCSTLRYNALLSAFSVILAGVFISRDFCNYTGRHSFTPRA